MISRYRASSFVPKKKPVEIKSIAIVTSDIDQRQRNNKSTAYIKGPQHAGKKYNGVYLYRISTITGFPEANDILIDEIFLLFFLQCNLSERIQ